LYNSGSMWPSVVVHEHWPVSQRMIVEMGDYAWSEHIVTVFLACQITIKNVQVQLTVKGKTTPDSYTPTPKSSCAQHEVFRWRQTLARPSVGRNKKRLPRPSGYEPVLSRHRFARSICTWTISNIPCLMKTLHQSYNDGMVNPEVVCHPSMAKTTVMHANSLPPFWYC
jgi:hypothetical protein